MRLRDSSLRLVTVAAGLTLIVTTLEGAGLGQQVFRTGVDLVTFGVTAVDKRGNLITDLTQADFEIAEDGRSQNIEYFVRGDADGTAAATHLGLMLDTSGSMEADLKLARSAAIKFLNLLPDARDITLVDFDTEVRVTRYPQRDFARLVERIRMRKSDGWTALYDALGVYLDGADTQDGRTILVMYTDGADSRSQLNFAETMDLLKASPVTVYAVGLVENAGSYAAPAADAHPADGRGHWWPGVFPLRAQGSRCRVRKSARRDQGANITSATRRPTCRRTVPGARSRSRSSGLTSNCDRGRATSLPTRKVPRVPKVPG